MTLATSAKVADLLLRIKAITLQPDRPFTWASGWKSPIYCDNRISLSHPAIRTFICTELVKAIEQEYGNPDLIAGVATAAIAQGVLVAEQMKLPFAYVRPSPKDHGRQNLIEGEVQKGQAVVVVEDLVSTGSSSLKAVQALRSEGCSVTGMISVFTYGFPVADENFRKENCRLVALCDYNTLLEHAAKSGYIKSGELETLRKWRESPDSWGK
ncbi:MAG: orotate phosphoribosyltransferase [Bacteroidia bacterium]|nr:orotate phosphoribosyltransferase [Bacteroidia bacterium]